jgi:DNA-binding NarL/FixJ family response regulator
MSIPDEKLSLILELFLNNEMEKRDVIKAIQRLAVGAFEAEKSAANAKARNAATNWSNAKDYTRWTERDENRVMEMRAQGYEYELIARELRRTTRSIRTKYLEVRDREAVKAATRLLKKRKNNAVTAATE